MPQTIPERAETRRGWAGSPTQHPNLHAVESEPGNSAENFHEVVASV